ncbi:MAG TPA: formate dehydrogenase accessory protein FdhE [Xanthobacteraceae bacterium]|nr:formate dehydrogenase accessory protein FdhE [Xanthobacteraceae bacterium]
MSQVGAPRHAPIPIGDPAAPPFVRLPDPLALFARRAERFRTLAHGHDLAPFLGFLAELSAVQHGVQDGLAAIALPAPDVLARAHEHGMPPLDRDRFTIDPVAELTLDRVLAACGACTMPAAAREALASVQNADGAARAVMAHAVLADSIPVETLATHVFVAAALQVHFARLAARLDPARLGPVGDGVCPVCGGPPVSSLVVGWHGAHGARFCACSLCGTLWNHVRIKCTVCGSTAGISYQEVVGGPGTVKAECCSACRSYVKILEQRDDPALDPVADDVGSLGLDLLMRETGLRRGSVDHFLLGY